MKTAFIYAGDLSRYDYGASHPLKPVRLKLTCELILSCGRLLKPGDARLVEPLPAPEKALLAFHSKDHIDLLKASNSGRYLPGSARFGLCAGDNPVTGS